jgi:hypothetical protein
LKSKISSFRKTKFFELLRFAKKAQQRRINEVSLRYFAPPLRSSAPRKRRRVKVVSFFLCFSSLLTASFSLCEASFLRFVKMRQCTCTRLAVLSEEAAKKTKTQRSKKMKFFYIDVLEIADFK